MIRRSVLCSCIVGAIGLPAGASAATPAGSGTSVLTLQTAALGVQGVTTSAVAPAKAKGSKFTFPVKTASVGKAATLGHSGGLRLRAGTRSVTLSAPKVRLAKDSRLTAKIGKATVTVLTVDGAKRKLNAATGSVALRGATVRLTVAGAAALRRALKLKRLSPGVLGTLTIEAKRSTTTTGGSTPGGATTPGGTTTTPGGSTPAPGPGTPTVGPVAPHRWRVPPLRSTSAPRQSPGTCATRSSSTSTPARAPRPPAAPPRIRRPSAPAAASRWSMTSTSLQGGVV